MAKQTIIFSPPESAQSAFTKCNDNFAEVYTALRDNSTYSDVNITVSNAYNTYYVSGTITVSLAILNHDVTIKNVGTGVITISDGSGVSTIDGGVSYLMTEQYETAVIGYNATLGNFYFKSLSFTKPCSGIFDTTTQSVADITLGQAITLNSNDLIQGSIVHSTSVNTSRIYAGKTGNYVITAEMQVKSTSANKSAYFWLRKNGSDVANTTTEISIVNANDTKSVTLDFTMALTKGDYIEFYFGGTSTGVSIFGSAVVTNPTRPVTPSVIVAIEYI